LQTFLFYDIETTGLNKAFDQVIQFAAIRTDLEFNELERNELKITLNRDVIPSAYATITHRLTLAEIAQGCSELEAMQKIHGWLNYPGTISLGYNTLGFDDEFLRFSFYRNLLPPYSHQFANQCGRADIYPLAIMYYLFKPAQLSWPKINGKTSLKLEQLNKANQLAPGRAHHAMVDVEATLALAKRLASEPSMWNYLLGFFNKQIDQQRLHALEHNEGLMIDGLFGEECAYQAPVLHLGAHRHYKNQLLWLRLDHAKLSKTDFDTIPQTTWVQNKKLGEPSFILPFKSRFTQHLTAERLALTEANKQWLNHHPELLDAIKEYYAEYQYPVFPQTDSSARLYLNGFWTREEQQWCQRFHTTESSHQKAKLLDQITNPSLQQLALRILGRHYPDSLSMSHQQQFSDYIKTIYFPKTGKHALIDYQGKKHMTVPDVLQDITQLREENTLDTQQIALLEELKAYLQQQLNTP